MFQDWLSFLSYLSNRNLCIVNDSTPAVSHENETVELITVSVKATLSSNVSFHGLSIKNVQGFVSTTGAILKKK